MKIRRLSNENIFCQILLLFGNHKNVRIDVRNIIAKEIAAIDGTEDERKEISLPGLK